MIRRPPRSTLFPTRRSSDLAVGIWNSWFNALIYLTDADLQPLQLILRRILVTNESLLKQATGSLASELRALSEMIKDRKSTRLNSSHANISYAVFCLKKKNC